MTTKRKPDLTYFMPTRAQIEDLKVGDIAFDGFGHKRKVTKITARGFDIKGKRYVCFYTEFGDYSSMSQSYKENELLLTTQLCANHTSVELMEIQREMQINRREGIRS